MSSSSTNPWNVDQLEDFQFFCCPECDSRCVEKQDFIKHALHSHPRSKVYVSQICGLNVKDEPAEVIDVIDDNEGETAQDIDFDDNEGETAQDVGFDDNEEETTQDIDIEENVIDIDELNVQCYVCGTSVNEHFIKDHMLTKHDNYNCIRWGKVFRHFQCEHCKNMFSSEGELSQHKCQVVYEKIVKNIKEDNKCPECHETKATLKDLKHHIKHFHNSHTKQHECPRCDFVTTTYALFKIHEKIDHKNMFQCTSCNGLFTTRTGLMRHEVAAHNLNPELGLMCDQCGKKFGDVQKLVRHHRSVHEQARKPAKCHKCNKCFSITEELNSHVLTCLESTFDVHCKFCDRSPVNTVWHSHIALEKHVREAHAKTSCVCEACGVMYSDDKALNQHKRQVHEGVTIAKCNVCEKTFSNERHKNTHVQQVHMKDKIFQCDLCPFSNVRKYKVAHHYKMKHGVYLCNKCDAKFSKEADLIAHQVSEHKRRL